MSAPAPHGEAGEDMEGAFGLYRRANKMVDMGNAFLRSVLPPHLQRVLSSQRLTFCSEPVSHNLAPSFESTVKLWLDQTATKTRQWADQALSVDTVRSSSFPSILAVADAWQFESISENGPSSSVTDLFDSFRSASDFLMDLNWPDEYQLAAFATRLARVSRVWVTSLAVERSLTVFRYSATRYTTTATSSNSSLPKT